MSSVRRATFLVILERVVLILAGMSVSIILARMLGPAGMGEWKLLMSVQNTSMYVLGLGLTFVVMRYTAEFIKDQRFDAVADILFRSLAITLIVIIVTGGSYLVFIKTTDLDKLVPITEFIKKILDTRLNKNQEINIIYLPKNFFCNMGYRTNSQHHRHQ